MNQLALRRTPQETAMQHFIEEVTDLGLLESTQAAQAMSFLDVGYDYLTGRLYHLEGDPAATLPDGFVITPDFVPGPAIVNYLNQYIVDLGQNATVISRNFLSKNFEKLLQKLLEKMHKRGSLYTKLQPAVQDLKTLDIAFVTQKGYQALCKKIRPYGDEKSGIFVFLATRTIIMSDVGEENLRRLAVVLCTNAISVGIFDFLGGAFVQTCMDILTGDRRPENESIRKTLQEKFRQPDLKSLALEAMKGETAEVIFRLSEAGFSKADIATLFFFDEKFHFNFSELQPA